MNTHPLNRLNKLPSNLFSDVDKECVLKSRYKLVYGFLGQITTMQKQKSYRRFFIDQDVLDETKKVDNERRALHSLSHFLQ